LSEAKLSFCVFIDAKPSRLFPLPSICRPACSSLQGSWLGVGHSAESRSRRDSDSVGFIIIEGDLDPRRIKRRRVLVDCNEASLVTFILIISFASRNFTRDETEAALDFDSMYPSRILHSLDTLIKVMVACKRLLCIVVRENKALVNDQLKNYEEMKSQIANRVMSGHCSRV
jgi:hypothetical protein